MSTQRPYCEIPGMNPMAVKIILIAVIAAILIGFGSGWIVQSWRLEAAHAAAMSKAVEQYHNLELKVEKQNGGIALGAYQLKVAEDSRKQAEDQSKYMIKTFGIQTKRVNEIVALNCSSMIDQLKGAGK